MKKRLCIMATAVALMVTGCASVPELSQEDNDMAAEYLAGELLKYSKSYASSFDYDRVVLNPTPEPTATPAPVKTAETASSGAIESPEREDTDEQPESPVISKVSVDKLYNLQEVSVRAVDYELKKNFGSKYESISAEKGNRLLIVNFKVKNTGKASKKVDLARKEVSYGLSIAGKSYGEPLLTIAEGDLQFFEERIAAGKSKQGVLIFQIPDSVKVKDVLITLSRGEKAADIKL